MRLCATCVLLGLVLHSEQRSTPGADSYVAAVVEYEVNDNVTYNVQNYVRLIEEAANQKADIIVFPEMTIMRNQCTVLIPFHGVVKQFPVPATRPDLYDEILVSISKAALDHQIYVVVNVQELMDCNDAPEEYCPERKEYVFNTNVVFDRTGAVIDRYRKINLFGEFTRTPALMPDLGVFSTDFGVTFGHFICFDLMFQVPALQVVEKHNLTDIAYSTMWLSGMPYLTAVQIQQAYAYAMNVNFLAAGANNVRKGSAGSGIYSGEAGSLISVMPGVPTTRLLVSKVPKAPGKVKEPYPGPIRDDPKSLDNLVLISDPSLPFHVSRPLVQGSQEFVLTNNEVSCKFKVKLRSRTEEQYYRYRAGAFDGERNSRRKTIGSIRLCSVFACTGDTVDTCGRRFPEYEANATAVFEQISIEAVVPTPKIYATLDASDSIFYPLSLDVSILPLKSHQYTFQGVPNGGTTTYSLTLNGEVDNLYSFAVRGKFFASYSEEQPSVFPPLVEDGDNPH